VERLTANIGDIDQIVASLATGTSRGRPDARELQQIAVPDRAGAGSVRNGERTAHAGSP
jgi:hypothetical protein